MAGLRSELKGEMAELRAEVGTAIADVRGEMGGLRGEMAELRGELRGEMGTLRVEVVQMVNRQLNRAFYAMIGLMATFSGLVIGLAHAH
jgi:hypothetical protein